MRKGLTVCGVLALCGAASPALAQYGAPFSPGFFATPEYTSGALGAGAAMGAAQSQNCSAQPQGRSGFRPCTQEPATEPKPKR